MFQRVAKLIIVCSLIGLFNNSLYAQIKLQLNKMTGLIIFSEAIIGLKNRPMIYKQLYEQYYNNNQRLEKRRAEFKQLHQYVRRTKIVDYEKSNNLLSAIVIESSFVKSIEELEHLFLHRYKSRINKQLLQNYFLFLKEFLPLYEELIWNKNFEKLQDSKHKIEELLKQINIKEVISTISTFYGLQSSDIRSLYVNLYPLPNAKNFQALRIENSAPVGIIIREKPLNFKWFLSSVVLHEYCHELFAVKKSQFKLMAEEINPAISHDKAFMRIFDESLQTAVSAGYIYNKFSKKLFRGPWYNNGTYDLIAKSIYLELDTYLQQKKPLDRAFMAKILHLYSKIK